jgi:hypothetical protein
MIGTLRRWGCAGGALAAIEFRHLNRPAVRLAKRMVNLYRLLRVRALTMEGGFERFVDRDEGHHRAAIILLAMNIGHPEVAGRLLRVIEHRAVPSFRELRAALSGDNPEWEGLRTKVAASPRVGRGG